MFHTWKKVSTYCNKYIPQSLLLFCLGTLGQKSITVGLLNVREVLRFASHSNSRYLKQKQRNILCGYLKTIKIYFMYFIL